MQAYVLNQNLELIAPLNTYASLIWSERYNNAGEFELETVVGCETDKVTAQGNYLVLDGSEHVMIIETDESNTDVDDGSYAIKSGRSLESILERRIIWQQTTINTDLETAIYTLLYNNVMEGAASERQITNFTMERTGNFTSYKVEAQYTGDNLYDVIMMLCQKFNVGFKIIIKNKKFVFSLYEGIDRSYDQDDNSYVVFSANFDNLYKSNYYKSKEKYKNVALVAGEGEGTARKTQTVGTATGLERRELFVDARDLSQNLDDEDTSKHISDSDYNAQLQQRGNEQLEEYKEVTTFEGEIDITRLYKYKTDFELGDIVQIETEQGVTGSNRIVEMTITEDEDGVTYLPTFA